jgi:hypothetical protein
MKKHRTSGASAIARGMAILLALLLTAVPVLAASYDLSTAGSSATINGAIFQQLDPTGSAGTGVFDSFVRIQAEGNDTVERGYNTDGAVEFETKGGAHTHALLLSDVPQVTISTIVYREFQLDIDEKSSNPLLSLDELQLFTACSPDLTGYKVTPSIGIGTPTVQTTLIYDLDAGEDNYLILNYSLNEGSGKADYLVYIPNLEPHPDCEEETYVYLYSRFGDNYPADDGFEEWGVRKLEVETGELEVIKDVVPNDETTNWVMTVTGPTSFDDVLHGDDTTGPRTVETGAYTIVETAGAETSLDDYNTTYDCTIDGGTGPSGSGTTINVTVGNGETVVCTFTNVRKQGALEVVKDVVPDDPTTIWEMDVTGPTPFNEIITGDGTTGSQPVDTGNYTINEIAGPETSLDDYTTTYVCTIDGGTGPSGTGTEINVTVGEGQAVVCTFTNVRKPGSITIKKSTNPEGGAGFQFESDTLGPFNLNDGMEKLFSALSVGDYTVTEVVPEGWDLNSIVCTYTDSAIDAVLDGGLIGVTIHLAAGDDVICTFNNKEKPTAVTLSSFTAEPDADGVTLAWQTAAEIDNAGFNLYRATTPDGPHTKVNGALIAAEGDTVSGASYTFLDEGLAPGTYYYKLEDVDLNGVTTLHGPVSATVAPGLRRPSYRPVLPD